jgi:hypothetical protein
MPRDIHAFLSSTAGELLCSLESLIEKGHIQPNEFVLKIEVRNKGSLCVRYSHEFVPLQEPLK